MTEELNQSSKDISGNNPGSSKSPSREGKAKKKKSKIPGATPSDRQEVLLKVGGLEYRQPGRRQRLVIGSIVVGLNLLLVIAVLLYFYNPTFQDFIFNVGRN